MSNLADIILNDLQGAFAWRPTGSYEVRFCCPVCGENDYKLYVNADREKFFCFKCEFRNGHHDFVDLYAKFYDIPRYRAVATFSSYLTETTPSSVEDSLEWLLGVDTERKIEEIRFIDEYPGTPIDSNAPLPILKYVRERGFTKTDVTNYGMRYVGDVDWLVYKGEKCVGNLRNRIIFPVYDVWTRNLVSYMARATFACDKRTPKYINSPGSDIAKTLAPAVLPANKHIVVAEGLIDAIALRKGGLEAYASFGKKLSERQLSILESFKPAGITVWFDRGAEGSMEGVARRLAEVFGANKVQVADTRKMVNSGEPIDSGDLMKLFKDQDLVDTVQGLHSHAIKLDSMDFISFRNSIGV